MNNKIKGLLKTEIEKEINSLDELEFGGEQHKIAVDGVVRLTDKLIDMEKIEMEYQDKYEAREAENEIKLKQISDEKKDRMIKNGLTLFTAVTTLGVTVWGTIKSIKFEETGTITTIMGRGFIQKLLPKK